ncbi:MAG: hypothetical protein M1838_001778 [Thelocarpon superellum]|nr:MAG: hypothetical protein M1838_001778 [Thelocarpon superellum]
MDAGQSPDSWTSPSPLEAQEPEDLALLQAPIWPTPHNAVLQQPGTFEHQQLGFNPHHSESLGALSLSNAPTPTAGPYHTSSTQIPSAVMGLEVTTTPGAHPPEREIVDQDGDLLVHCGDTQFLVSSKVLSLISPMFKAIIATLVAAPQVSGATPPQAGKPLELQFPNDNADVMALLFYVAHYSPKRHGLQVGSDRNLKLIELASKYDCIATIRLESQSWLRAMAQADVDNVENRKSSAIWQAATAAYILEFPAEFAHFTSILALQLPADELEGVPIPPKMPATVPALLNAARRTMLQGLIGEVEKGLDDLCLANAQYSKEWKVCAGCAMLKPPPTKKCGRCGSMVFRPAYCDRDDRVHNYITAITAAQLRPMSSQLDDSAIAFHNKVRTLREHLHHACSGIDRCPLMSAAAGVKKRVDDRMAKGAGLDLRNFPSPAIKSAAQQMPGPLVLR